MDKDRITAIAARGEQINNVPPFTPGFAWNSTTQEFIEILPQGHPDYRQNAEMVSAAIRRWNAGTSR